MSNMRLISRHILLPALMSVLFFSIAFSPVHLLGCRTRGLLAFGVSLLSGLAALGTGVIGLKSRIRSEADSKWWMISAVILTIPVIWMIILA